MNEYLILGRAHGKNKKKKNLKTSKLIHKQCLINVWAFIAKYYGKLQFG